MSYNNWDSFFFLIILKWFVTERHLGDFYTNNTNVTKSWNTSAAWLLIPFSAKKKNAIVYHYRPTSGREAQSFAAAFLQ